MTERLVVELRCDCLEGYRVHAVLPDGSEFVTDAAGTTSSDFTAWRKRVRKRLREMALSERIRAGNVLEVLALAQLYMRPCQDCRARGWLMRVWQPEKSSARADPPAPESH